MKKQKRKPNPKPRRNRGHQAKSVIATPVRKRKMGELGILDRDYPPSAQRRQIVEQLRSKPEHERSADDWWRLGEFLVFDGLMDENDGKINTGIQALMQGANHETPSAACMLDLGWILMFRGFDSLALPHLQGAVDLCPESRDAWTLKGLCHIGNNQRALAAEAYERATNLPNATESDKSMLAELREGADLRELRRNAVLTKVESDHLASGRYASQEQAKFACHILRPLLERDPKNCQLLYCLASARYALNQFDKAKPLLLQLLELSGGHAPSYAMLGLIAKKERNDREEEKMCYARALEIDPGHLLSLVNLACSLQDRGEYHAARPLLERALEGDERDPNYALALDLYGTNVAAIEQDFAREADFHQKASLLDAKRPIFKVNHITALLSAGRHKEARSLFQVNKDALRSLPNFDLLSLLVEAFTKDLGHPYVYMQIIDKTRKLLGWKAMGPLVQKAWAQRVQVDGDNNERKDFCSGLGTFAGRAGLHEVALEIWKYGTDIPGGEGFYCNQAVELSALGRHAEALEIADRMPKNIGRTYTVLGNVRNNAGQPLAAVAAYRQALEHEEPFLLPISNAIDCLTEVRRPDLLTPFIMALDEHWSDNPEGALIKGQALLVAGRPSDAADTYAKALTKDRRILDPDEIWANKSSSEDLTVWRNIGTEHHKAFATALILSARHDEFGSLFKVVSTWAKWNDGDWTVFLAESHRRRGDMQSAEAVLQGMRKQPPPLITQSLCKLEQGDFDTAREFAEEALNHPDAHRFNHIEGRPDAVAAAILAMAYIEEGKIAEAVETAKTAVSQDIGCPIARTAYASALLASGSPDFAVDILVEGLERAPGRPAMVRMAVETLVQSGALDQAKSLLASQRTYLNGFGVHGMGEGLGELIALEKLEQVGAETTDFSSAEFEWLNHLDEKSRAWVKSAVTIRSRSLELKEAYLLYLSKVAEQELLLRVARPFKASVSHKLSLFTDQLEDFSRYLSGGRAPSIGGVVRGLILASRPFRSNEPELVTELRNFLKKMPHQTANWLRDQNCLRRIRDLSSARNAVAHVGDPVVHDIDSVSTLIIDGSQPGDLIGALIPATKHHNDSSFV